MAGATENTEEIFDEIEDRGSSSGPPFVTLSYAQSLDGSIAARKGAPLILSGSESMALTHRLRAAHDAILVGIGTVLADDPRLTVRLVEGHNPQPVVLDSHLRIPESASLFDEEGSPWIATLEDLESPKAKAIRQAGASLLEVPPDEQGRVALPALLGQLGDLGVRRLMVEGGASVITSFLSQSLVNLVVLTIAPIFIGGRPAVDTLLFSGEGGLHGFPWLDDVRATLLGKDLLVWGKPVYV